MGSDEHAIRELVETWHRATRAGDVDRVLRLNRRTGHTLSVLRKQSDGAWVIFRDANMLAPATGEA